MRNFAPSTRTRPSTSQAAPSSTRNNRSHSHAKFLRMPKPEEWVDASFGCDPQTGTAFIDGPNLLCELYRRFADASEAIYELDLLRLRSYLTGIGFGHFLWVHPFDPNRSRGNLEAVVRRSGWRLVEPSSECRFGRDARDCVDDYIRHRIEFAAGVLPAVALISHDGGYCPALRTFLTSGGVAAIIGFRESLSQRFTKLSKSIESVNGTAHCYLVDLDTNVAAVTVDQSPGDDKRLCVGGKRNTADSISTQGI